MEQDYQILRIPGPTPIPPSVQQAMMKPMIGHRTEETKELLKRIKPKVKALFGSDEDVAIIAGSGTAGLEAAIVNTVSPGDEVLVIVTGSFGDRIKEICESYNMRIHHYDYDWGTALRPVDIKNYLESNPSIKAVFATYCETSTGVINPVQELAAAIKEVSDALLIVDGVSCIGAVPMQMDDWGIDICVTGSQKALMLPPGLTFIATSKRARKVMEQNNHPRFYFDLRKYHKSLIQDSTPFTPALSLLYGLEQSLQLLELEGLENVFKRHHIMKKMTRAAFQALAIPLLTNETDASPTVTAIQPNDINPDQLRTILKKDFRLVLAGGQNRLKGKIFRIGHMGFCSPADVLQTISCLEIGLLKLGKNIHLGTGVKAAQEVYIKEGIT